MTMQKAPVRELAWTVVGASAGSLVRHWVDLTWPGRALVSTLVVTAVAAGLVGFAFAASIRASMKAVLIAAGGAAASLSAIATRAASALPTESIINLAVFFVSAVTSVLLGMLLASSVSRNAQRDERR